MAPASDPLYQQSEVPGSGAGWYSVSSVNNIGQHTGNKSVPHIHREEAMEGKNPAGLPPAGDHFYYFAYGSNLLKERILLDNPSASFHSTAMLKDFKLAFGNHKGNCNSRWHGGVATVIESEGDEVWGVVWKMDISSLDSLDIQEGVGGGIYQPIEISVQTDVGEIVCRCYQMNKYVHGLTSPQYKQVMCMGAKQNKLPPEYQKMLEDLETNNYSGPIPIMNRLKDAIRRVQDDG